MRRALAFALLVLALIAPATAGAATAPRPLGLAPTGQSALEFVARIEQRGPVFEFVGYVTYARGLGGAALFTDPAAPGEATARLKFSGRTDLTGRSVIRNVFALTSRGSWDLYWDADGGGTFDDPASFAQGTRVGSLALRFHNVLGSYAANEGISTGTGEAVQRIAGTFAVGGRSYRLGRAGLVLRLFATGLGTRTEPNEPRATLAVAGDAVVVA
jgi:hypothetical protein